MRATTDAATDHLSRVAAAIEFTVAHSGEQPSLAETARVAGLSPQHFQRVFQRCVGLSPKRFLQHLTVETARSLLAQRATVLDATYGAGLSGPGRLHDHCVTLEALTPGERRSGGEGLRVHFGHGESPLGVVFAAWTDRGVCQLSFVAGGEFGALRALRAELPRATFADDGAAPDLIRRVFAPGGAGELRLLVRGTNFQVQVWRALLRIPEGAVHSYQDVARSIGRVSATRAVASAVARNPVAVLIPCHRVIRKSGALGGYRWGEDRKRALLAIESARAQTRRGRA